MEIFYILKLCDNNFMQITEKIKNEFKNLNSFEIIFPSISILVIIVLSVVLKDSKIALISAVCGILYTLIAGKGKPYCYFFGMAGTLCYCYLAYKNTLYGNLLLNGGYYLPMEIIGFFAWNKHLKKETNEIEKTSMDKKSSIILYSLIFVAGLIFSFVLKGMGDKFFVLDSFITIISIAAMYLTVKRCVEQWLLWSVVNMLSIIVWFNIYTSGSKTFATLLMWCCYLVIGIYYYINWKKDMLTK